MRIKSETTIEQLLANTRELLEDHWAEASAFGSDEEIKVTITHVVEVEKDELVAKSQISFSKRVKDTIEHVIDSGQTELALDGTEKKRLKKRVAPRAYPQTDGSAGPAQR